MKVISVFAVVGLLAAPAFAGAAEDSAALYKAKCASCHAADGSGETPMGKKMNLRHLGSEDVQKQSDAELYAWTADGKGKMPGYKTKLSEAEINGQVAFMRTLAKK